MHVNLKTMKHCLGKLLMMFTIALAVWNAQCFANCLTQIGDAQTPHCHPKGAHCPQQHDVQAGAARQVAPDCVSVISVEPAEPAVYSMLRASLEPVAPSPPASFHLTSPLPLRV